MDELERFVKVVGWLDEARWAKADWWDGWKSGSVTQLKLSPDQKVLAHWLTYITDMKMSAKIVWTRGLPVFAAIVKEYVDVDDPSKLLRNRRKPKGKGKVDTYRINDNLEFTPRYPYHHDQIKRTLVILKEYDKSLVQFISKIIELYGNSDIGIREIAHALYLLTYTDSKKLSVSKTIKILQNRDELDRSFKKWNKNTTNNKKRLWAALRDYVKHDKLCKCFNNNLPKWSEYINLSDLELPGDVWNGLFAEKMLFPLAERNGVDTKGKRGKSNVNAPMLARRIYEKIASASFYPEQLDVSFDIASRMCDKSLCDICVFGKNKAKDFCAEPGSSKLCPVILILTGNKQDCSTEYCPIITGDGKGLCKGQVY